MPIPLAAGLALGGISALGLLGSATSGPGRLREEDLYNPALGGLEELLARLQDPQFGQSALLQSAAASTPTLDTFLAFQRANRGSVGRAGIQFRQAQQQANQGAFDAQNQLQLSLPGLQSGILAQIAGIHQGNQQLLQQNRLARSQHRTSFFNQLTNLGGTGLLAGLTGAFNPTPNASMTGQIGQQAQGGLANLMQGVQPPQIPDLMRAQFDQMSGRFRPGAFARPQSGPFYPDPTYYSLPYPR